MYNEGLLQENNKVYVYRDDEGVNTHVDFQLQRIPYTCFLKLLFSQITHKSCITFGKT